jgi:ribonuclease VapC
VIAIDSSAIVAILLEETDAPQIRAKLLAAGGALISTGNVLELQLVAAGHRNNARWSEVEAIFRDARVAAHPFDERQLAIARDAAVRYGKGRHKAALNFGDCFAYALAKSEAIALLCKGGDFAHTDIELV